MPIKFKKLIAKQSGLTIAEVLIMIGVSSVFMLGLAELVKSVTVANKTQNIKMQATQLENEISTILNDPDLCSATLAGQPVNGAVVFQPPAIYGNKIAVGQPYQNLTINSITSTGAGGNYTLTVQYAKPRTWNDNTLGPPIANIVFNYTATGGANIATCKANGDQQACVALGGIWGAPVANECNFNNMNAATCASMGGTWDAALSVCSLSTANKNSCQALGGTWTDPTGPCTGLNGEVQDAQKFCTQLCGGQTTCWVADPSVPGGFKCDFTKTFSGDCTEANANLVPNGSGTCEFRPATADACNAIGGIWLMSPYPHCELNPNVATICPQLGCTWTGAVCNCPPSVVTVTPVPPTPPPPATPLPVGCSWTKIAKNDTFKEKYMYALEWLYNQGKIQDAQACVAIGPGCDEMGPPVPGDCTPIANKSTYSQRSFDFCLQNCGPQIGLYRCDCTGPAQPCSASYSSTCTVGGSCTAPGAWNQFVSWVAAQAVAADLPYPSAQMASLASMYNASVAQGANFGGTIIPPAPLTEYIALSSNLVLRAQFVWQGLESGAPGSFNSTVRGQFFGAEGPVSCGVRTTGCYMVGQNRNASPACYSKGGPINSTNYPDLASCNADIPTAIGVQPNNCTIPVHCTCP